MKKNVVGCGKRRNIKMPPPAGSEWEMSPSSDKVTQKKSDDQWVFGCVCAKGCSL